MPSHNRKKLRQFIHDSFSDEELTTFCFDYFPQVYSEFTTGMSKNQKVIRLVGYAERRHRLSELHAALKRENPDAYEDVFGEETFAEKLDNSDGDSENELPQVASEEAPPEEGIPTKRIWEKIINKYQ